MPVKALLFEPWELTLPPAFALFSHGAFYFDGDYWRSKMMIDMLEKLPPRLSYIEYQTK